MPSASLVPRRRDSHPLATVGLKQPAFGPIKILLNERASPAERDYRRTERYRKYRVTLQGDTVRVLWALHQTDPELNTAIWPGDKRGGRALRLKTPAPHSPPQHTQDITHWDVKLNQVGIN